MAHLRLMCYAFFFSVIIVLEMTREAGEIDRDGFLYGLPTASAIYPYETTVNDWAERAHTL